jgi:radical SAM superfamily enzyme YgiQ (UPF0313 family)
MKLLFINLYPDDTIARYLLSSYVLSAYINEYYPQKNNLNIKILNFSKDTDCEKILNGILKENPDLISYSCYVWNINKIIEIGKKMYDNASHIQIFGGPDISIEKIRESFHGMMHNTFFVIGEGERKLLNLLKYLDDLSLNPDSNIPKGIAFWENNTIQFTPDKDIITNLDEIPSIFLNHYIDDRLFAYQQAFLETQRGCRFRCKYCVYHKNNAKLSYYSQERIFNELDYLIVEKKIKALRIFDSIFTSDLQRAKNIVQHLLNIKNQNHTLPWIYWEFTYNSVDEEFIKLVSKLRTETKIMNCNNLIAIDRPQHYSDMLKGYTAINCVGIQSFSEDALRAVGRPKMNLDRFCHFMDIMNRYNTVLKIDIILGLPEETVTSYFFGLEYILNFFKNTDHILNIHRLQILPGTDLEKECKTYSMDYSQKAPYYVYATESFPRQEMEHAARFSALLFRIVNSPLRSKLFKLKDEKSKSLVEILAIMLSELEKIPELQMTGLFRRDWVDDNYWNGKIYSEIPSKTIVSVIDKLFLL